ncbi:hypothetical protein L1987_46549 [Smallanthus sonchifolius]|uniref:Uncharacterized protein n=1 Tax=Smallanthus sonchifolius TaxID=185202 RepID=A0ACB9G059_9ASTR|nr:hypothetical protein L1987_46549 [Smallanthus sonchifolius]
MGRRQDGQGRGDGNANENQVPHSPHLSQNMDSISQNYQASGSSIVPLVPYSPDSSTESYHPSSMSSIPSQNMDKTGTQTYDDGVRQLITNVLRQLISKHSPLSWGQNLFDLNLSRYVNEDLVDVEYVEDDQAVQVTDCIRLTRHPCCDTE